VKNLAQKFKPNRTFSNFSLHPIELPNILEFNFLERRQARLIASYKVAHGQL
jgi:hypothetical protein